MRAIAHEIQRRGMTVTQAAEFLGEKQPTISYLVNEHAERHSLGQLLGFARQFGLFFRFELESI